MDKELSESQFKNIKSQIFGSLDSSRKGSVDLSIVGVIEKINAHSDLVTTSSCSGRIIVVSKDQDEQKEGCKWVYITHDEVSEADFIESVKNEKGNLVVKFEPFILHIQCRTLKVAKSVLTCALQSGYRNSGIVLGKHGKIMVAVRSTLNMEVPIAYDDQLLVDDKYLIFLIDQANQKMEKNQQSISKFEEAIATLL